MTLPSPTNIRPTSRSLMLPKPMEGGAISSIMHVVSKALLGMQRVMLFIFTKILLSPSIEDNPEDVDLSGIIATDDLPAGLKRLQGFPVMAKKAQTEYEQIRPHQSRPDYRPSDGQPISAKIKKDLIRLNNIKDICQHIILNPTNIFTPRILENISKFSSKMEEFMLEGTYNTILTSYEYQTFQEWLVHTEEALNKLFTKHISNFPGPNDGTTIEIRLDEFQSYALSLHIISDSLVKSKRSAIEGKKEYIAMFTQDATLCMFTMMSYCPMEQTLSEETIYHMFYKYIQKLTTQHLSNYNIDLDDITNHMQRSRDISLNLAKFHKNIVLPPNLLDEISSSYEHVPQPVPAERYKHRLPSTTEAILGGILLTHIKRSGFPANPCFLQMRLNINALSDMASYLNSLNVHAFIKYAKNKLGCG